jgi:hypothetical protein
MAFTINPVPGLSNTIQVVNKTPARGRGSPHRPPPARDAAGNLGLEQKRLLDALAEAA